MSGSKAIGFVFVVATFCFAGFAGWAGHSHDHFVGTVSAEEADAKWGDLSGQFIYGGEPPVPEALELNKDAEFCGPFDLHSEQLRVDKESRGIANVVIWLEMPRRQTPPIHESYAESAKADVLLANKDCRFVPHVTTLRTTQKLLIKNDDKIAHNTAAYLKRNLPFNAVSPPETEDRRTARRVERAPAKVSCSIHAWMTGWLLVQDHPYMAVTDKEGRFTIKNLPAGEWTFHVWHEVPNDVTAASQESASQTWKKGLVTVTVKPGENDFGQWTLDPKLFK
ncbi:hypothetical protein [Symmachiella dynata]|uniref:hypothetical protein n=1 Tax=Symmachiella dynata TaxID=2527995 RepID=UPI0030EC3808